MKTKQGDFVQSLARGLLVIRSFNETHRRQTLSDVARSTGLDRAVCRRLLLTLTELGYVRSENRHFSLSPAVLELGYAYLSAQGARVIAQPHLEALSDTVHESSSMTVLDSTEIVYVARVPTKKILSIALGIGSRLPAYCTSTGRVMLSDLPREEADAIIRDSTLDQRTHRTITDPTLLRKEFDIAREQGWYLLDEELELGIRAVAAPIRDESGRVVAAINVSTAVARTSVETIHNEVIPTLMQTAANISEALANR